MVDIDVNVPPGGAYLASVRDGSARVPVYSDAGLTQAVTLPYQLASAVTLYVPPIGQFDYRITDVSGAIVLGAGNARGLSSAATPLVFRPGGAADLSSTYVRYQQAARTPDQLISGAVTRDSNGAATSAAVVWPDGSPGTYTGTPSASFPGAIDSYTITYGSPVTRTYTQPAVTRDATGAAVTVPSIVVS